MSTLEKLDAEMASLKETSEKKLDDIPYSVQGAWSTAIREAKEKLKAVKAQYREVLLRNAVAILLGGDQAKVAEFATLAREEGAIVVDATSLYERLAADAERSLSDQRTWGVHQAHMLHRSLQEVMAELNLTELPMPSRAVDAVVPTHEDVVALVRKLVEGGVGTGLNTLYLENEVAKRAFEIRYIGVTAPVLLVNAKADDATALAQSFGKGETSVTVNSDEEINKDYLAKVIKKIRKK